MEEQVGCVFLEKMADLKTLYERAMAVDEAVAGYVSDARQAELLKMLPDAGVGYVMSMLTDEIAALEEEVARLREVIGGAGERLEAVWPLAGGWNGPGVELLHEVDGLLAGERAEDDGYVAMF